MSGALFTVRPTVTVGIPGGFSGSADAYRLHLVCTCGERVPYPTDESESVCRCGNRFSLTAAEPAVTHGRHCPCTGCANEDWTRPDLAACGMHGPDCPPIYAPIPAGVRAKEPA